jgi:hypothetical protein
MFYVQIMSFIWAAIVSQYKSAEYINKINGEFLLSLINFIELS